MLGVTGNGVSGEGGGPAGGGIQVCLWTAAACRSAVCMGRIGGVMVGIGGCLLAAVAGVVVMIAPAGRMMMYVPVAKR